MADTKITALAAIGANPINVATFPIPMVDLLDNSMAASGTTKKVTVNQILGAGGTATLASATITGDLTVDTSTLKVDSANNRVGVGTATPANPLHISGTNPVPLLLQKTGSTDVYISLTDSSGLFGYFGFSNGDLRFQTPGQSYANKYVISSDGTSTWSNVGGTSGTAMTLNSTGLGVGGVPTGTAPTVLVEGIAGTYAKFNSKVGAKTWSAGYRSGTLQYEIQEDGTERFVIANGGNVGIGVTPSAWGTGYSVLQVGIAASLSAYKATNYDQLTFGCNHFENTIGQWRYTNNGFACQYLQLSGQHIFRIAGNNTSGANQPLAWTQAMTLDASGNLLVGTTTANGRVAVDTDLAVYNGMSVKNTGTTYGASSFFFRFINSSGATAGSIQHTAVTTTNYSTTSDARLKESKGISNDTSVIDNTVVHDFIWKADGSTDRGVFAQEAHAVKPRAVSVGSDELTEDGNIKTPWSVDYSKFVPDLIVYCQQLKKQVVELTARVQTLEAK